MPPTIEIVAGATGSVEGSDGRALGTIGTVLAAGVLLVQVPVNDRTERVKLWTKCNLAHSVQAYLGENNELLTGTLTLTDATAVDDGDTFVFNGLTFTGEATEGDASAAARKYWLGANNAAAAVNLCALLNDPVYGVPGFDFTVAAVDTTDVISFVSSGATALHFAQGTSASGEIAFASTTLANLRPEGALHSGLPANTTTKGPAIDVYCDGLVPYFAITNNHATDPATMVVEASRFAYA